MANEIEVNWHKASVYGRGEIQIKLDMNTVATNKGRVYLRRQDLEALLQLLDEDEAWAEHRGQNDE